MKQKIVTGILLDERAELTLIELSRACSISSEWVIELVFPVPACKGHAQPCDYNAILISTSPASRSHWT